MASLSASGSENTIFVHLPNKETLAIRRLPDRISLQLLKARIELQTGILSNCFQVAYGEVILDDDQDVDFNSTVRNGGVVRIVLPAALSVIYESVHEGNIQKLNGHCHVDIEHADEDDFENEDDDESCSGSSRELRYFALFLACRKGQCEILEALTSTDPNFPWRDKRTPFGRTLAHIAAVSDQVQVMSFLSERNVPILTPDDFGKSALDEAVVHGSCTCERFLRQSMKNKHSRASKHRPPAKSATTRTVCWADSPRRTIEQRDKGGHSAPARLASTSSKWNIGGRVSQRDDRALSGTALMSRKLHSARSHSSTSPRARVTPSKTTYHPGKENQASHSNVAANHKDCVSQRPFMAFRSVTREELRPVAVEFVPLENTTKPQHCDLELARKHEFVAACPVAPQCSPTSSVEDLRKIEHHIPGAGDSDEDDSDDESMNDREKILQKREEMKKRYSRIRKSSLRAQSAKYYKTKYHNEFDDGMSIPKARPATAGPRYREWKTWLLDKMEENERKEMLKELNKEQHEKNAHAYKKWLRRKQRQELEAEEEYSSDDDDDSSIYTQDNTDPNERAYKKWLAKKKDVFEKMDSAKGRRDSEGQQRGKQDRKVTIFELGSFSDKPLPPAKPNEYMRAYQTWQDTRTRYEKWKKKKGIEDDPNKENLKMNDIVQMRGTLLLEGMTYQEWLGLKEREHKAARLHVHNIGGVDQMMHVKPKCK